MYIIFQKMWHCRLLFEPQAQNLCPVSSTNPSLPQILRSKNYVPLPWGSCSWSERLNIEVCLPWWTSGIFCEEPQSWELQLKGARPSGKCCCCKFSVASPSKYNWWWKQTKMVLVSRMMKSSRRHWQMTMQWSSFKLKAYWACWIGKSREDGFPLFRSQLGVIEVNLFKHEDFDKVKEKDEDK